MQYEDNKRFKLNTAEFSMSRDGVTIFGVTLSLMIAIHKKWYNFVYKSSV